MACFNDIKCRMEGEEAAAMEETEDMRAQLLNSINMGYGDCTPPRGEHYSEYNSFEGCRADCMNSGQRWISINDNNYCYCEYEDESIGGCESNTGSDYYVHYKSF